MDSFEQAGPMVQMILARRRDPFFGVGFSFAFGPLVINVPPERNRFQMVRFWPLLFGPDLPNRSRRSRLGPLTAYGVKPFFSDVAGIAVSSLPSIARGNSKALNSAPTRTTREIIYIQTSKAMPAPSDP